MVKTLLRRNRSKCLLFVIGTLTGMLLHFNSVGQVGTPTYLNTTGTTPVNAFPTNSTASNKVQWIYAPGAFTTLGGGSGTPAPAGNLITKVYIKYGATVNATNAYTNFTISLGQNVGSINNYPEAPATTGVSFNTGLTQCFFQASGFTFSGIVANAWYGITLQTPFLYNPSLALVAEVKVSAGTGNSPVNLSTTGISQRLYAAFAATTGTANTGLTPLGFDMIPAAGCTAPPTPGTSTATPSAGLCLGANIALALTGNSTGSGQTYQWQESTLIGGPYTNIGASAAVSTLNTAATTTKYYRCVVTCSGNSQNSVPVLVTVNSLFPGGTYTINSAIATGGGNFQTFADAITAIQCGIAGPVIFNVDAASGPYTEQITIPSIGGTSAINTVTFNGNGRTIQFTPNTTNRHVIKLDGADFVAIKNLNIVGQALDFDWGVHLINGADNDSIVNCTINLDANTSTTQSNSAGIVASNSTTSIITAGNNANNLVVQGCTVRGAYAGIVIYGNTGSINALNNRILNNTIRDFYAQGVLLNNNNGAIVRNNDIHRTNRVTVTTFAGVELGTTNLNAVIDGNRIHDSHTSAATQTGTSYGIFLNGSDATVGNENRIINNLIYKMNSGSGVIYGLYNSSSDGAFYYHNTVVLDNAAATAGITRGFYQLTLATNIDLKNNIIHITRGGTGAKNCLYFGTITSTITSNYNNLFLNAPAGPNGIGFFTTNQITLGDWQAVNGAIYDQQSLSINSGFLNPATNNYQPSAALLNNTATPVGVTVDLNGNARSVATPDYGAYEFDLAAEDIGVISLIAPTSSATKCYSTTETVTLRIQNYGLNAIDFSLNPAVVTCNVTGATTATLTGTPSGILAIGGTMDVVMSTTLDMSVVGTYIFDAFVVMTGDLNTSNDAMLPTSITTPPLAVGSISSSNPSICVSGAPTITLTGSVGNVQWQESLVSNSGPWTNVGSNSNVYTPSTSITDTTWYQALISCNASSGVSNVVQVNFLLPQILSTVNDTVCGQGSVTLSAISTGQGTINWYNVATGGTALGTGNTYTTNITGNATFYAEEQISGGGGSAAAIQVTEMDLGGSDRLEIQNVSPNSVNVTGWKVVVSNSYTDINSVNANVQTLSGVMTPGQTMSWTDAAAGPNYWGSNILWNPGAFPSFTGWAAILDNNNVLVDIVFLNWPSANIQAASIPVSGGPNITVGAQWSGNGIDQTTVAATQSVSRQGISDNNLLSDFSIINLSFGSTNPGMNIPFTGFGCSSIRVPALGVSISAPAITVSPGNALCPGDSIGLQVSSINDPNYVYTWTSTPSGFNQSGSGIFYVTPLVNTTYSVSALDTSSGSTGGCLTSGSIVVIPLSTFSAGTVTAPGPFCVSGSPTITVSGASGFIQWQQSTVGISGPWTNVGIANSTSYSPGVVNQNTYYRVLVSCISTIDSSAADTVIINNPSILSTTGDSRCGPGILSLQASVNPGVNVNWYANASGGSVLGTGTTFTTPLIGTTTNYYAEAYNGDVPATGGRLTNVAGSVLSAFPRGIIFNATEAVTIDSVGIRCSGIASTVTVQLYNSGGTATVGSPVVINIPANSGNATTPVLLTFPANIAVPAAGTYRLFVTSVVPTGNVLWYEFSGVTGYPYAVGSKVSITSSVTSLTGAASLTTYYYFYKLVVGSGCVNPTRVAAQAEITPAPPIAISGTSTICAGDSTTISITSGLGDYTTFSWFPTSGLSSSTGTTIKASPAVTTKYYVLATGNVGNCQALDSITITVNDFPLSVSVNNPMVCGVSDSAQITTTATGGTFTYLWTPAAGLSSDVIANPKARPVGASQTYTLAVTNTVTGCSKTRTVTIYKSSPAVLSTVPDTLCGTGVVSLLATATPGTQISWWSAATGGTRLGTGSPFSPTISATTKYYVEARDTILQGPLNTVYTGGVIATDPNAAGNMFDITAINNIRVTGFNVHLKNNNLLAPSNVSVYYKVGSYSGFVTNPGAWTLAGSYAGLVSAGAGVPTYLPLHLDIPVNAGQTYGFYIVVTNLGVSNSLVYSSSATSPAEFAVASSDFNLQVKTGTICFGPFTGQVAAPVNRLWNGGVLYSIGCISSRDSVEAVSLTAPALTVTTTEDSVCLGSSTTLQVSSVNDPNYSYVWTPNGFNGSTYAVSPTVNTVYTVTATDTTNGSSAGCSTSSSINIVVNQIPAVPVITQNPVIVCGGSPVTLTAASTQPGIAQVGTGVTTTSGSGVSPFSGLWEGANTQYLFTAAELNALNIFAGQLTSIAFNVTTASTTIALNNYRVKIGSTASTALSAYIPGLTQVYSSPGYIPTLGWNTCTFNTPYVWDGVSNLVVEVCFNNDPTGSCTGGSGVCYSSTSAVQTTVTAFNSVRGSYDDNTTPIISFDPCSNIFDTPTLITSTARPNIRIGYGALTNFLWSTGAVTPAITVTPPIGTTNYSVTATNLLGCTSSNSINVITSTTPKPIIFDNDTILCNPDTINVNVVDTGLYVGGYPLGTTFTWSAIGVPVPNLYEIGSNNGSSYSVIVTLPNGCSASSDTASIVTKSVAVNFGITPATCLSGGSITATVSSGSPNFRFVWSTDPSQTNIIRDVTKVSNVDVLSNQPAGQYYLQVYDTVTAPAFSCNSGVIPVTIGGTPPIVITSLVGTNFTCKNSADATATVSYTGGQSPYTITWSDGQSANTTSRSIPTAGTYSVIVSDNSGCADTASVTITEPDSIIVTLTSTPSSGANGTVTATATGGNGVYTYLWADEFLAPAGSVNPLTGLPAGLYYSLVTDGNLCTNDYTGDSIRVDSLNNATLNLTMLIEGYFDGVGLVPALFNTGVSVISTECDTIRVELRDQLTPANVLASGIAVLNTSGQASFTFPGTVIGANGYIAVFHRNAVETWSPVMTFAGVNNYNFTTAATQAEGSNQREVLPGKWAFYSGDLSPQDGTVDILDQGVIDNDIFNFASGYVVSDITGDNTVDIIDQGIVDNNIFNFIGTIHP